MHAPRHLACILALLAVSCGGKGGGTTTELPTTLCTPETKACLGNYATTCALDGRSWTGLRPCFPDGACVDGACTPRACTPAGKNLCQSTDVAVQCSNDGRIKTFSPCPKFESCYGGACLPDDCDAKKDVPTCTFDTRVVCVDGKRTSEPCPVGSACVGDACVPKQDCMPEEARCSGDTAAGICRLNATGYDVTECKSSEHCVAGFCLPRLADLPTPDVIDAVEDVPEEVGPEDALEVDPGMDDGLPPDTTVLPPNRALLNGVDVVFDFLPSVSLVPQGEQVESQVILLLQSGHKDNLPLPDFPDEGTTLQIEIAILGVPIDTLTGLVGTYPCGGSEGPRARVWLRYGLNPGTTQGACTNYDFGAGSCTVVVTDVGPDGAGPLKGTFEAPGMADCREGSTKTVSVTGGAFDAEL